MILKPPVFEETEIQNVLGVFEYRTTKSKWKKFDIWYEEHMNAITKFPTMGEVMTIELTPTSLGLICVVRDNTTKDEFDLTDYESW